MKLKTFIKAILDRVQEYKVILYVPTDLEESHDMAFELNDYADYIAFKNYKVMDWEEVIDPKKTTQTIKIWLYQKERS